MTDGIRILVADDEPVVIRSAERVLGQEGYRVEGVPDGREAILRLEQSSYDLVLTDLRMPGVDGIMLIRWIKKARPSTGIVVVTGYPSQETMKEARELGIIDYVPKPYTPEMLKNVTNRATDMIGRNAPDRKPKEEFPASKLAELDEVIGHYRKKAGSAIPVLQKAQEIVGYLPCAIQKRIARGLNLSAAEIHSIVSFYSFFTMKPRGDHTIRVCLGTACYVKGIETVLGKIKDALQIDVGETTEDGKFTLEAVRCVGACGLAPVMVIDQDTHGALTQAKAINLIGKYSPAISASLEAGEAEVGKEA